MNTCQTKEGWWIIEQDSHVGAWIRQSGRLDHDQHLIPIATSGLKPDSVCIDAGALYGDHTIAYARACVGGVVIAIESNPLAFECLKYNMQKAEGNVICINAALGETHGGRAMHEIHPSANIGMSTVSKEEVKGIEIPTVSIDGIVKDSALSKLDFIKIDCEGWELSILKGAKGTLKPGSLRPAMMIEINSYALAAQGATPTEIYELLLELEYEWKILQPQCKGGDPVFDILCIPKAQPLVQLAN